MKRYLFLVAALAGLAQLGSAAPMCTTGTLASFVALGSGGCMIANNTFSGFKALSGINGAIQAAPSTITVTPSGSSTMPTLTFGWTLNAGAGTIAESIFNYTLTTSTAVTQETGTLSNTSTTGDGVATFITNFCVSGMFGTDGVTGCTGTSKSAAVIGNGSSSTQFMSRSMVSVTDDLTLDGGLMGSASGGTAMDQFTTTPAGAVPEPATFLLTGLGFALAAGVKLGSKRAASVKG